MTTPREAVIKKKKFSFYWEQDGTMKNSNGETPQERCIRLRNSPEEPVYSYAVSSVERNMFLLSISEALILANPPDADMLLVKAERMLALTPYTNWSGD